MTEVAFSKGGTTPTGVTRQLGRPTPQGPGKGVLQGNRHGLTRPSQKKIKQCDWICKRDKTGKHRVFFLKKPASEQVSFTKSVKTVTEPEFKVPFFLELKTQSFSYLSVSKIRVLTQTVLSVPQGTLLIS